MTFSFLLVLTGRADFMESESHATQMKHVPVWYAIYKDEKRRKSEKSDPGAKAASKSEVQLDVEANVGRPDVSPSALLDTEPDPSKCTSNASVELALPIPLVDLSDGLDQTLEEENVPLAYYRNLVREKKGLEPLIEDIESDSVSDLHKDFRALTVRKKMLSCYPTPILSICFNQMSRAISTLSSRLVVRHNRRYR